MTETTRPDENEATPPPVIIIHTAETEEIAQEEIDQAQTEEDG